MYVEVLMYQLSHYVRQCVPADSVTCCTVIQCMVLLPAHVIHSVSRALALEQPHLEAQYLEEVALLGCVPVTEVAKFGFLEG